MPVSLILTPDDVVGEGRGELLALLRGGALQVGADDAEGGEAAVNVGHQLLADDGPNVEGIRLDLGALIVDAREELSCGGVDNVIRILQACRKSGEDERRRDKNGGESPECDIPHSSHCSFLPEAASEAGFVSALPSPESDDFAPML